MFELIDNNQSKPISVTIVGDRGIGKTRLASSFPDPIIIRTEDGTRSVPNGMARISPVLTNLRDVAVAINEACKIDDCGSVIIDSITTLDTIVEQEIVDADPRAKSLTQAGGGYGAGARDLAGKMRKLRSHCDKVLAAGKNLVFVAHSAIEAVKPVDTEAYNLLTLRMNKGSIPPFTDLVDCVAHMRLDISTTDAGGQTKDVIGLSGQNRVLICYPSAAIDAKNRLGIVEPLPCKEGENPIMDFLAAQTESVPPVNGGKS